MIRDLYYLKMISLQTRSKERKYSFQYEKNMCSKSVGLQQSNKELNDLFVNSDSMLTAQNRCIF